MPIETNPSNRPSRLFKSTSSYVFKSTVAIIRLFVIYRPLKVFSYLGLSSLMLGILLGIRYLLIIMMGDGGGNIQSLILASILITIGVFSIIIGFIADLLSANRKLIEDLMYKINKISNKD